LGLPRKKHIGKLLERTRKSRGLTADEVAVRCNVTRGRIYQWEKQTFILPKNLPPLSAALSIPLTVLLNENGPRPTSSKKITVYKNRQTFPRTLLGCVAADTVSASMPI
jgi:transcriptional regulator with XRE-family HTH domain